VTQLRIFGQASRGNRRGNVFAVRISNEERAAIEAKKTAAGGPKALGPWLVWRALEGESPSAAVVPVQDGHYPSSGTTGAGDELPEVHERTILDLCAGSGAWSKPYVDAGYAVRRVTLPELDVRTLPYIEPGTVWGVLAAPPCTEFSLAKNGRPRDFVRGMETVNACLAVVLRVRPRWWVLENPGSGYLAEFLGPPRDSFQPHEFGDPWTKRTALWGEFAIPKRGPFVEPNGSAMDRPTPEARAVTPSGFARAFFEANP
jgi:hypothetical protein